MQNPNHNDTPHTPQQPLPLQSFDPRQDYSVIERRLPHWSQAGTIAFITWRAWDSMPAHVVEIWLNQRDALLRQHGIDPSVAAWQAKLDALPKNLARELKDCISARWNEHLDALHGAGVLRRPEIARIVADSLVRFHGERYQLTDYVVMPNHVHVLAAFLDEDAMLDQCDSWKHYTAREINRSLGRKGRFWHRDGFDRLVRSTDDFEHYRRYIADNPVRARLKAGQFLHESLDIRPSS
jgi:type I restriction enzyme R subunit